MAKQINMCKIGIALAHPGTQETCLNFFREHLINSTRFSDEHETATIVKYLYLIDKYMRQATLAEREYIKKHDPENVRDDEQIWVLPDHVMRGEEAKKHKD